MHVLARIPGSRDGSKVTKIALLVLLTAAVISLAQVTKPLRDRSLPAGGGTCRIAGRVTDKDSGQPVARATVALVGADSSLQQEVVADADGRYEFAGVAPGEYAVWAGPPELRATHLTQVFGQPNPTVSSAPPAPNIELKPGETRTGLDIALARALAIEGRVLDPWGDPMANARLEIRQTSGRPVPASGESDDRGVYRLFGLAPGRYRVCATPVARFVEEATLEAARFVRTCYPDSIAEAGAGDVVLAITDATDIDIRMQRTGTYTVSGSIVGVGGALVDRAYVSAFSQDDSQLNAGSDSRGDQFVVKGLAPGRYFLYAGLMGPPEETRPDRDRHRDAGFAWVDISGGDVSGVVIPLSSAQTLSGRVLFESGAPPRSGGPAMVVQTRAIDLTLPGAVASLSPSSPVDEKLGFTLNGLYRLPLVVGIYNLPDGWVVKAVRFDGQDVIDRSVDLGNPDGSRRLEFVLTDRVADAAVRVTDEQGQPVTACRLVVLPADPERWKGASLQTRTTPSPDGVIKLGARAPGDYLIAALTDADYEVLVRQPTRRLEALAAVATRVTLGEGDTRTFEMQLTALPGAAR